MVSESEGVDLVAAPVQRMEGGGLSSQILFHDVSLQFNCGNTTSQGGGGGGQQQRRVEGDPVQKTRGLSDFIQEKVYSDEREQFFRTHSEEYRRRNQSWNGEGSASEDGSDGDEDDEEEEEDEEDDEGDGEVEGLVVVEDGNNKINNNSSGSIHSSSDKLCNEKGTNLQKLHSSFGSSRGGGVMVKDGSIIHCANNVRGSSSEQQHQEGRVSSYENSVTIAEPDTYYSQFLQGSEGGVLFHKVIGGENGCGGSGRKDLSFSKESGDSLRAILSDPMTFADKSLFPEMPLATLTRCNSSMSVGLLLSRNCKGSLMDDAMILPCGHSFGSGGMQHVVRMKACYTCSQPVSEDSMAPNLSLRSAVQAFRREEELQSQLAPKRRRERFELNKSSNPDPFSMDRMDHSRGKGVHFPFSVTDRVIIKGNKRTPLRFVGREAVVTTQCLNGWYVVKTLDNAESVKLQYRSLAKASDTPSSNITSSKAISTWI